MTRARSNPVGYKNPPKETRFKPGVSGNPKGRPKGRVTLPAALEKAVSERVVIRENGRSYTVSKLEAAMKQVANKAANGDLRAIRFLTGLLTLYGPEAPAVEAPDPLEDHDQQLLATLTDRMRRGTRNELHQLLTSEASDES